MSKTDDLLKRAEELQLRLNGEYITPIKDGAGLLDGMDTFTRKFDTPPICKEAAALLKELHNKIKGDAERITELEKVALFALHAITIEGVGERMRNGGVITGEDISFLQSEGNKYPMAKAHKMLQEVLNVIKGDDDDR